MSIQNSTTAHTKEFTRITNMFLLLLFQAHKNVAEAYQKQSVIQILFYVVYQVKKLLETIGN